MGSGYRSAAILDGRNRAIVIAESLARVIAAIRIASVRWRSYLPRKHRNESAQTLPSLCRDSNRAIGVHALTFVPGGTAEWPARVDRVRQMLAIGDFCPSKAAMKVKERGRHIDHIASQKSSLVS